MLSPQTSTLLLTLLLAIGLVFFLRAASKDRTTVVDVASPRPPLEVLEGVSSWLEQRGWSPQGGDAERQVLRFKGSVAASTPLALLLSVLGRAARQEGVEIRLMNTDDHGSGSTIRLRAHRDELIALELELAEELDLASDGSLLSSPI